MDKIFSHNVFHLDNPDFTFDFDRFTVEKLKKKFDDELTAMHIIQQGDTRKLEEFMDNSTSDVVLGYSTKPLADERAFVQRIITLASLAAVNGGVDCTVIYSLIYKYQNLIEQLDDSIKLISLTYEIMRAFCNTVAFQSYKKCKSPVLLPVLRYIHSNLNTKITVDCVASKLNMNANYLTQLFKKEMGINFSDYVLKTKIALAKHLMATSDKSIADISEYLAFSSPSHFNNTFKKITGTTPKQYLLKVRKI